MAFLRTYKIIISLCLLCFCIIGGSAYSQSFAGSGVPSHTSPSRKKFLTRPFENKVFIEEQGQFKKSLEEKKIIFPGTILFAVNNPEFNAYFTAAGITFVFSKTEKPDKEEEDKKGEAAENTPLTQWETMSMQWVNTLPSMQLTAKEKVSSYYTYGKYADNSQYDHVSAYKKLYYSNIYEGVDAEFELPEKGGIKYQFIVHAGFKIPDIAYSISGTKNLYLDESDNLHIEAALGNLIDKAPNAFTKTSKIPVKYNLTGNLIEINAGNKTLPLTEDMVIDPWLINPAFFGTNKALDIGEDSIGNVYVNGGDFSNYQAQKYNSIGVLQWTHPTPQGYGSDIAVGNSGSVYLAEGVSAAKVTKLNPAGAVIYSVAEGAENWRLSFNKSKTILAMGGNFGASSLTKIDTATGVMGSTVSYPSDTWAVATDCNGDIYSLHYGASPCILRKTNADFTPALSALTTGFCVTGYSNAYASWGGYNALTISGPYLYIYDGLQLRRFLKTTLVFVNSVPVPNGTANNCSGIAFDFCGNIYVGTMSSIEKYDALLNPISSISTSSAVYDIIIAGNGDLLASGNAFVGNFGPTCPYPPQLSASAASTNVSCRPGTASILASGGTTPYSYLWQPGGQSTAIAAGLTAGTYTYIVNDAFCQSKTDSVVVIQTLPLSLSLGAVQNESCPNSRNGSATVTASGGTGPYSFYWNTNPIQTTQTITGLSAGTYIAGVVDADSCIDTVHVIITRNQRPIAAFSNTSVCYVNATQFTDNSVPSSGTISSRVWDFGDSSPINNSQNPAHLYANAGSYNVNLIVNNSFGCADTITKPVHVYYKPNAGFTHLDVCFRDSMHFTNTSAIDPAASISSYLWKFGDGSPSASLKNPAHEYSNAGKDTVTLITTTTDGCSDTASAAVNSFDPPTAVFIFNAICLYDSAHFVNNSVSPVMGTTASWIWSFGDGSPLNTNVWSPHHIFANPGSYLVTFTVHSSNLGCPDTLQAAIIVPPTPIAGFSFTNVCSSHSIHFNNLSTVTAGSIVLHSWDFGDGSPADTASSPSHTYSSPGTYSVRLIVTTDRGCKDTIVKNTVVHPLPSVYFNALDVCDQNIVHFNDFSSILPTDTIQSWRWNFADGSPRVMGQNTSHLYALPGSYLVQLMAVSNFGCSDSINKTIIVHPNPIANFKNTHVCQGIATQFTDTSTTALGSITAWSWDYGDASALGTIQNPSRLYTSGGMYNVTLIVTNNFGCADTITKPVLVYYNPAADFSHIDVCFGDSLHFTNTSTITLPDSLSSYLWVFGDAGPTGSTASPAHYYSQSGTYNVTLLSRTSKGCSNALTHAVKAYDAPHSAFTYSNICLFDSEVFSNTTIPPVMGSTAGWTWNYGDNSGLNTTAWSPVHHYPFPGHYQVTLVTRSSNLSCADTLKDSITVYTMPIANYSFTNVCLNQAMIFNDSSRISSGSITVHSWNFGDGTLPNGNPDPSHLYANPGTRTVTLIVTSSYGCKDTSIKSTVVHPLPHARIYAKDVCNGTTVQLADSSFIALTDTIHSWRWNFADNSPVTSSQNTSHLYGSSGVYPVQLYIASNFGCLDSVIRTITINPNPQVSFTRADSMGCEPLCTTFQNTSTIVSGTNTSWIWIYGDGSQSGSGQGPYHCYSNDSVFAPNLFDVTLTVTSDSGCISTKTKTHYITVYPAPRAGFSALPGSTSIINPVITITDQSIGTNYWHWNFGDQDTTSMHHPLPHTYADTGTYRITLIASTQYNCIDTAYQTIFIEPDFVFYIPNTFTPNDDGINDVFSGKGIFIKEYEMMIFDRWGNLIFYSDDANKGWDGTANHGTETAQQDIFVYTIKITDFKKLKHSYKGIVTLIR